MSNDALKAHLRKLEDLRVSAKSKSDISKIVKEIKEYSKSGSYIFQQPLVVSLLFISLFATLIMFFDRGYFKPDERFFFAGVPFLVFIVCLITFIYKRSKVTKVGQSLAHSALALENGLVENTEFDGYELWRNLKEDFNVLRTGDEGQMITSLFDGETSDGTSFQLFEFKYVKVTEQEKEDSNGNKTKETNKTTHYKYGILTHLHSLPLITINEANKFKEKWDSSSKIFNKKFKIRCINPIETAKFFTPACILKFEESFDTIKSLDMTYNSYACLIVENNIFPTRMKVPNIKNTDEYISYLLDPPKLKSLIAINSFINYSNSRNIIKKEAV